MPLNGMIVKTGSTAMTPTGGSDKTLTTDGVTVQNGLHLIDAANADFRTRANCTIKNKPPTLQADGKYSKDKKSVTYVQPKLLADGSTVFNLVRIEREVHPESTAAEALDLCMIGSQLLADTDLTSFWSAGSLA